MSVNEIEEDVPEGTPVMPVVGIRYGWANAAIIGGAILIWLTLIGTVITAIVIAVAVSGYSPSDPFTDERHIESTYTNEQGNFCFRWSDGTTEC